MVEKEKKRGDEKISDAIMILVQLLLCVLAIFVCLEMGMKIFLGLFIAAIVLLGILFIRFLVQ
jgi:hypothetical protein